MAGLNKNINKELDSVWVGLHYFEKENGVMKGPQIQIYKKTTQFFKATAGLAEGSYQWLKEIH